MVRIRLRRVGRKKQPSYRLVAADKESPRDGRFIEILGFYNPRTEPATIKLKEDRIYDWLSQGAQPSKGAEKVLRSAGFFERYDRFKAGEDLNTLLEESAAAEVVRNISPKTRHDDFLGKAKKAKSKVETETPVEIVEEPEPETKVEEVEAPVEEPVKETEEEPEEETPVSEEVEEETEAVEPESDETPPEETAEEGPVDAEEESPSSEPDPSDETGESE
jgi:small subunit ribosomal protein S16